MLSIPTRWRCNSNLIDMIEIMKSLHPSITAVKDSHQQENPSGGAQDHYTVTSCSFIHILTVYLNTTVTKNVRWVRRYDIEISVSL